MSQEVRLFQEGMFTASDETSLYFRHWSATEGNSKKVIVLFHRGHEHSGRLQHIVDELMMPDTHFLRVGCAWTRAVARGSWLQPQPCSLGFRRG